VAVCDSGDIAGVCIFDSWTDAAAEVHICIENPMCLRNGGLLKEMFGYAFNSCNRAMLIARIPEGNPKSLNFAKRVGFKEIYLIPDAIVQGEGLVGLQLKREDCRYIEHLEIAA
jgi:L-amino acid N-acyltransferase YncA